jgi:hypothetical protein
MQGASNVQLDHSTQGDQANSSAGTSPGASTPGGCGSTHGKPNYAFQVDVAFDPRATAPYQPGAVPSSLGGGQ